MAPGIPTKSDNYSVDEVVALVENYAELSERIRTRPPRSSLWVLVRLADLVRAFRRLTENERRVLVLHGVVGLPSRELEEQLGLSHVTALKRYGEAAVKLTRIINGRR